MRKKSLKYVHYAFLVASLFSVIPNNYGVSGSALPDKIECKKWALGEGVVKAWKILDDAGETELADRIDDIKFIDDFLKNNLSKTPQSAVDDIKVNGWHKWKLDTDFLNKIGKVLPDNWNKFTPEFNVEFAERLKSFRGSDDLIFDPNLRGGEAQIFDASLSEDLVLKRWFASRVKDMPKSIRLLKEADRIVKGNTELSKRINVVSVGEQGSDWTVRGYDPTSAPLKDVISDPVVSRIRQEAIDILSQQSDDISASILTKLNRNSANIHWSLIDERILIIDML